jgi:hypothetical protein
VFGFRNKNKKEVKGDWDRGRLTCKKRSEKIMQSNSGSKKMPYRPPVVAKVTPEQARQFVANRVNWSDQEAANLLESLRRELKQNEEVEV